MEKIILVLGLLVSMEVFGGYHEDPNAPVDMNNNLTNKTFITIQTSKNIQADCERESKNRGFGGFGFPLQACSFWDPKFTVCTIVISETTNHAQLGHELQHCLQGNYH
jgi:hypothetical protein